MKNITIPILFFFFSCSFYSQEFDAGIQIRPRFEYRNGFKTLLEQEQEATSFISQRSRLNLRYSNEAFKVVLSMQNVRTWGDVPPITAGDKFGLAMFEAYAEYTVNNDLFVRMGRQVLSYDNQRILGGLDWAQQGQSHDILLLGYSPIAGHQLHLAYALNEDGEDLIRTPYTVNSYKNMQLARYEMNMASSGLSFTFLNTAYESILAPGSLQHLQTFGSYYFFKTTHWAGDISAYGQTGERANVPVKAWYAGGNLAYKLNHSWAAGVGAEYLSGTAISTTSPTNNSFTPLFGTNHAFNGYMDYFYVGNHLNSVGLTDLYGKISYNVRNAEIFLMPHLFYSAAKIDGERTYLGTEIDLAGSHKIRRDLTATLGYSQMFGSRELELLKGGDRSRTQNWAWLMISFHPQVFSSSKSPAGNNM